MNEHGHGSYFECFIKGLRIFQKYGSDVPGQETFSADHDIIYVGTAPEATSEEDKKTLDELGFHECSEYDCWGWFT